MIFIRYHLPVIVYAGLIFLASSISTIPSELPEFSFRDKIIHITEFMILGSLMWRSAKRWNLEIKSNRFKTLVFVIGAIYAASDEIHQLYVPGRNGSFYDWLADIIGLAIGLATTYIFYNKRKVC